MDRERIAEERGNGRVKSGLVLESEVEFENLEKVALLQTYLSRMLLWVATSCKRKRDATRRAGRSDVYKSLSEALIVNRRIN